MSFTQGLSGLNAASKALEVIGNNVANANTVGFKGSQAQFADVFAAALSGGGLAQIGIGTRLATVAQQFVQGNITATDNTLDLAINGPGFFVLDNGHGTAYSRNGQFQLDKNGYIVSSTGSYLQGYTIDPTTQKAIGSPTRISVPTGIADAQATGAAVGGGFSGVTVEMNLDSSKALPTVADFNPTDPNSFNDSTSLTTYDSKGVAQTTTLYFKKTAANTWDVYVTITDPTTGNYLYTNPMPTPPATAPAAGAWASDGTLSFGTNGRFTSWTPAATSITNTGFTPAGANPQTFPFDFSTSTQFGASFGVTNLVQDGFTSGRLVGFSIDQDGIIQGRYSNGVTKPLAQVSLANFPNMQGLQPLGNNEWAETRASGQPTVNAPGQGNNGVLQTSSTEDSNVDLSLELVNMITAQRTYQANAQTIKTEDAMMQTLVNLR